MTFEQRIHLECTYLLALADQVIRVEVNATREETMKQWNITCDIKIYQI